MTYALSPEDIRRCRAINMRYNDRVKEIALAVSAETSIPISLLYSKTRKRHVVEARWIVMYLAAQRGLSQQQIGTALNLDHTSVCNGIKKEAEKRAAMNGEAPRS